MRLLHLHIITEYKNLKDFKIDFDGTSFIDVFVGKNGTGKSNMFEALLEIFKHIYGIEEIISFDYKIVYSINEQTIALKSKDSSFVNVDDEPIALPNATLLPTSILIHYSGHNNIIKNFTNNFNLKHKDRINAQRNNPNYNQEQARKFFSIGKEYKTLLLFSALIQTDESRLKTILKEKLGINEIGLEIKIVFKKPDYAAADTLFEEFDEANRFWGTQGYFKDLLNLIFNVEKNPNPPLRDEGSIGEGKDEKYILYRLYEKFKNAFNDKSIFQTFITLDNLKTIGILEDLDIKVKLVSGKIISLDQFSDGQFQSIYILCLTEIFKDFNCISLLDEPDSFLHPEWQFNFFDQIKEISEQSTRSNHLLISSHSAITLLKSEQRKVNLFKIENNNIINRKVGKDFAINQLSSNLLNLKFEKHILSVIHTFGQEKPILFTEGYSDPIILRKAFHLLYDTDDIPFEICFGHGCEYLRNILQNDKFLNEMNGMPIFGLFDFDEAYAHWNSVKTSKALLQENHFNGLIKQHNDRESYAILIPVPVATTLHPQILKADGKTFENNSNLEMEHLFYNAASAEYFVSKQVPGGGTIIEISDSRKLEFATDHIPTLGKAEFEVFRPIFDFITSKIPQS